MTQKSIRWRFFVLEFESAKQIQHEHEPLELCIPDTRTRLGLGELNLVAGGLRRRRHVGQQVRAQLEGAGHAPCDEVPVEDDLNPLGLYCLGRATADLHRIDQE